VKITNYCSTAVVVPNSISDYTYTITSGTLHINFNDWTYSTPPRIAPSLSCGYTLSYTSYVTKVYPFDGS
jgi:hypothetical protein